MDVSKDLKKLIKEALIDIENEPTTVYVHVTNVEWDATEEDLETLPKEFDLTIAHYSDTDLDEEVSDAISDKYGFTHLGFNFVIKGSEVQGIEEPIEEDINTFTDKVDKADNDLKDIIKTLKEDNLNNKQMVIEFSIENPNHYEDIKLSYKLIITKESNGTYSWKETSNLEEGHDFKTAAEAYEDAVEFCEYPLSELDDFEIDKDVNDVIKYFEEDINENLQNNELKVWKTKISKIFSTMLETKELPSLKGASIESNTHGSDATTYMFEDDELGDYCFYINDTDFEPYDSVKNDVYVGYYTPQKANQKFFEMPIVEEEIKTIIKEVYMDYYNTCVIHKGINESLLDDRNNIEKFYAPDLKDAENLNNIWTIREFTDNMDSKDGKTLCKYTKIGLIDYLNSIDSEDNEDFEEIPINYSNKDLFTELELLGTDAELVSISNYNINNLYDEPNQPKE